MSRTEERSQEGSNFAGRGISGFPKKEITAGKYSGGKWERGRVKGVGGGEGRGVWRRFKRAHEQVCLMWGGMSGDLQR
jgi:hypothetical protein